MSDVVRMADLQDENAKLKRTVSNLTLEIDALNMPLENLRAGRQESTKALSLTRSGRTFGSTEVEYSSCLFTCLFAQICDDL